MKEAVMDFVIANTYQDRQGDKIKVLDIAENPQDKSRVVIYNRKSKGKKVLQSFHDILMDTIKRKEIVVGGTYTAIQWDAIVGKWQTEADREVFKQTTTYSEVAASFLADSYKQYNDAETDTDKNTIMEYVVMRYPNLDTDSIDNATLRQFYNQCLNH